MGILGKDAKAWKELEKKEIGRILAEAKTLTEDVSGITTVLKDIEGVAKNLGTDWQKIENGLQGLKDRKRNAHVIVAAARERLFPLVSKLRSDLRKLDEYSRTLEKIEGHLAPISYKVIIKFDSGESLSPTNVPEPIEYHSLLPGQKINFALKQTFSGSQPMPLRIINLEFQTDEVILTPNTRIYVKVNGEELNKSIKLKWGVNKITSTYSGFSGSFEIEEATIQIERMT
ncbi:hypothetical protein HYV86_04420 [Candidatus Woesearchaeota archaeon]|nr:hypothetical protein [Candidatus Woesearchaeota archaeon]